MMTDQKKDAKPEVEKATPEEKLTDADLKAVTGGAERKRDLYHKRLTSGFERSPL